MLHAGAVHDLSIEARRHREAARRPEFMVVSLSAWRDDPALRLVERLHAAAESLGLERSPDAASLARTLDHYAQQLAGGVLVILDQFEEYFLYHPCGDGEGTFAVRDSARRQPPRSQGEFPDLDPRRLYRRA